MTTQSLGRQPPRALLTMSLRCATPPAAAAASDDENSPACSARISSSVRRLGGASEAGLRTASVRTYDSCGRSFSRDGAPSTARIVRSADCSDAQKTNFWAPRPASCGHCMAGGTFCCTFLRRSVGRDASLRKQESPRRREPGRLCGSSA